VHQSKKHGIIIMMGNGSTCSSWIMMAPFDNGGIWSNLVMTKKRDDVGRSTRHSMMVSTIKDRWQPKPQSNDPPSIWQPIYTTGLAPLLVSGALNSGGSWNNHSSSKVMRYQLMERAVHSVSTTITHIQRSQLHNQALEKNNTWNHAILALPLIGWRI
jgi:hypothetical protein